MKRILFSAAVAVLFCISIDGQLNYGYSENRDTLFSSALNEKRPLTIYLPEGYEKEKIHYPVIYILDADTRCPHGVPTIGFLSSSELMPKAIVIGIPNVDRERDFLPGRIQKPPTGDGADNFLRFISEELFPYIDSRYRSENFRVLIGHSFGGVFAMHTLLSRPDAFDAFIIIDPSLWYDSEKLISLAAEFFTTHPSFPKSLYISGNKGDEWHNMRNDAIDSVLHASAPVDLRWKTMAYENENHGSVTFKTIYDGLKFVFNDYRSDIGMLVPERGMIVKNRPYYITINSELKTLLYIEDGSDPSKEPMVIKTDSNHVAMLPIDKACTVTLSASSHYEQSGKLTGRYDYGIPMEPSIRTGSLTNGLQFKLFEGNWDKLPDFTKLKPYAWGVTNNFAIPGEAKKDFFGVEYEGFILIAEEGYYDIVLNSDDGSRLLIDKRLIIDNDGLHGAEKVCVYRLYLKPGYHSVQVDYFEKNGNEELNLELLKYPWGVGSVDMEIPDEQLFYNEN
jgi:predicted alpha/beta superfamily hydrolase